MSQNLTTPFLQWIKKLIYRELINQSTDVGQAVSCAPVTQRARVRSTVGTGFLGDFFFRGFSSPVRHMSGNFRLTKVPEYHLAAIIIISYSPYWTDRVCAWCASSFMFVRSRRWPRHWADPSSGEALHVPVWSKKYVCDPEIVCPYRSWLCKARAAWVT